MPNIEREREALEKVPFATRCQAKEASLIQGGSHFLTAELLVQRNEHILLHADAFCPREGDGWSEQEGGLFVSVTKMDGIYCPCNTCSESSSTFASAGLTNL